MPISAKEKKDQKEAKERIFRKFAEKDLSLSANEIIRRAKDKDVGIREKDAKAIIRGLKGVKKKEEEVLKGDKYKMAECCVYIMDQSATILMQMVKLVFGADTMGMGSPTIGKIGAGY